jgi:hypothetical protein
MNKVKFWKLITNKKAMAVMTFLAILIAIPTLILLIQPHILLEPGVVLDSKNIFSTPFILKNQGTFSIYNISSQAEIIQYIDSSGVRIINSELESYINNSYSLKSNKETTLSFQNTLQISYLPLEEAEIQVLVTYKPFLLKKRTETFNFVVKQSTSREYVWLPMNK